MQHRLIVLGAGYAGAIAAGRLARLEAGQAVVAVGRLAAIYKWCGCPPQWFSPRRPRIR